MLRPDYNAIMIRDYSLLSSAIKISQELSCNGKIKKFEVQEMLGNFKNCSVA